MSHNLNQNLQLLQTSRQHNSSSNQLCNLLRFKCWSDEVNKKNTELTHASTKHQLELPQLSINLYLPFSTFIMVDSELVYTTQNGLSVCLTLVTASLNIAIYRLNSMSMHKYIVYRVRMLLSCVFSFSWSMFGWTWLLRCVFIFYIFIHMFRAWTLSVDSIFSIYMHSPRCCTTSWWRTFRDFLVLSVMQVRLPLLILFDKLVETFHDKYIYFFVLNFLIFRPLKTFLKTLLDAFDTLFFLCRDLTLLFY